jgi:ribosome-associated protein
MTSETAAKKDVQRLQRAIVDGLEDVKGQDIVVFNTEALSPLFERVIVASGTSNRQTKALAASVRDAVREAGFDKPRIEGEENGEWIIVDCGSAVAHVMQPVIREYYRLEEIWGAKPVRLKHGAAKPVQPTPAVASKSKSKAGAKKGDKVVAPVSARNVVRTAAKTAAKAAAKTAASSVGKTQVKPAAKTKGAHSSAARPVARKSATGAQPKAALKTVVVKPRSATRPTAKKSPAKSTSRVAAKKKA